MDDRRLSDAVQSWVQTLETSIARVDPAGPRQVTAYGRWFEAAAARQEGRRGRLAEADPFVPAPVWWTLVLGAVLVIGYVLLFADPRESWGTQAAMIGAVTAIVGAGLLVVRFLDSPYGDRSGSIRPTQMGRTLDLMQPAARLVRPPCGEDGKPPRAWLVHPWRHT